MRKKLNYSVLGTAALVVALSLGDVVAGNYTDPAALTYNVEILLGQNTSFSPSNPEPIAVTVDDITYDVQIDMCSLVPTCLVFTAEELRGQELPGTDFPAGPLPPPFPTPTWIGNQTASQIIIRWADARGADFGAELVDSGEDVPPEYPGSLNVDAVSHMVYSQLLARETFRFPAGQSSASAGLGVGVGTNLTSQATSESRHFQTPYVMRGDTLTFQTTMGLTPYAAARVIVKGRAYFAGSTPPPTSGSAP